MTKVSVLLPAHNAERFVEGALVSISAQTLSDWEVIAVDDASRDRTHEILSTWQQSDSRIRVFRNEQNAGMTANWNRCLSHATGELVIKLDADDQFRPWILERLASAFQDPRVIGAGARTLACSEDMEPYDGLPADDAMMRAGLDPYRDDVLECERWYPIAAGGHQLWHSCAVMFRRQWMTTAGGFDERFGCASDTDIIWRLLEKPGKFAHFGGVGLLYRTRAGSVSDLFRSNQWLKWEGIVGNLASLHRWRKHHPLSRYLRLRYVELWRLWNNVAQSGGDNLPPAIFQKLASVASEAAAPPVMDRIWGHISSFAHLF